MTNDTRFSVTTTAEGGHVVFSIDGVLTFGPAIDELCAQIERELQARGSRSVVLDLRKARMDLHIGTIISRLCRQDWDLVVVMPTEQDSPPVELLLKRILDIWETPLIRRGQGERLALESVKV